MQEIEETKVANETLAVFPFLSPSLPFVPGKPVWITRECPVSPVPWTYTSRHTAKRGAGSVRLLPSKKTLHTIPILCFAFPHLSHTSVKLEKRKNGALSYLFNYHGALHSDVS